LAPFILFALIFDRFDFGQADAAPVASEEGDAQVRERHSAQPSARLPAGLRRDGARSRRDRAGRWPGAATWN
jgi:hypothetical protein